jgi:hypothetical protein
LLATMKPWGSQLVIRSFFVLWAVRCYNSVDLGGG